MFGAVADALPEGRIVERGVWRVVRRTLRDAPELSINQPANRIQYLYEWPSVINRDIVVDATRSKNFEQREETRGLYA